MRHLEQSYYLLLFYNKKLDPEWKATQQESFVIKKFSVELNKVFNSCFTSGASSFSHCGRVTKFHRPGPVWGPNIE